MAIFSPSTVKSSTWPISVGAEGIVAAQFARCGFDVLVQAGRDKPSYDLVVTRGGNLLKVSVKASENGQWPLTNGFTRRVAEVSGMRVDCRSAIDMWRAGFGSRTVCCLVQFEGVHLHEMPRMYLASPDEIAATILQTTERTGDCTLYERYDWAGREGMRVFETLPAQWHFSQVRIQEMLQTVGHGTAASMAAPKIAVVSAAPAAVPAVERVVEPGRELALSV